MYCTAQFCNFRMVHVMMQYKKTIVGYFVTAVTTACTVLHVIEIPTSKFTLHVLIQNFCMIQISTAWWLIEGYRFLNMDEIDIINLPCCLVAPATDPWAWLLVMKKVLSDLHVHGFTHCQNQRKYAGISHSLHLIDAQCLRMVLPDTRAAYL